MPIIGSPGLILPAAPPSGANFLQRLIDDAFTSIWKLDEASGDAIDTQGVTDGTVSAGVTRGVTSIIPNKPGDDAMGFDDAADTIVTGVVATYNNMFESDLIFLLTLELSSNANSCFLLSRFGGSGHGLIQYRRAGGSDPRRLHFQVSHVTESGFIMSDIDAIVVGTPALVEAHWFPASPDSTKIYVDGVDVTDMTKTVTPIGAITTDNSVGLDIFSGTATSFPGTGQYAAIKLGTGNPTDAADRFTIWNTAP